MGVNGLTVWACPRTVTWVSPPGDGRPYHYYRRAVSTPGDGGVLNNGQVQVPSPDGDEVGVPGCSNQAIDGPPDRRTIFGAVLNCVDLQIDGGRAGPYEVHAFVKFFITEPVPTGANQDIFAEMVDVFEPGADGENVVRDDVQLYR